MSGRAASRWIQEAQLALESQRVGEPLVQVVVVGRGDRGRGYAHTGLTRVVVVTAVTVVTDVTVGGVFGVPAAVRVRIAWTRLDLRLALGVGVLATRH